jgi:hypothetical protein
LVVGTAADKILLKEFFMVKKTFVFFVVLSIITVGIVFAASVKLDPVDGVYITYNTEGGYATIHNTNKYGVTVSYTVYYENGDKESDSDWCAGEDTESFYIGGLTQDITNIKITSVKRRGK